MKRLILRLSIALVVVAAVWGGWRFVRQFEQKQQPVPTATVRRGDVVIRSYTRGELRAVRSVTLVAPNLFGTVQVTKLAPVGALAREKNLIVEFDDSEVRSRLEEKQLEIEQLDEQLKKAQAELEIRNNQDQVELLRARYAVRRAELEVKRNELLSEIDATKNKLNLDEANRRLKQLESDLQSRLEQSQAELAVLREKKNKALLELQRERLRLSQVRLLAPMAGLVAIRQSRPMGMFFRGMQLPDIREGDQVYPGTPVADVLDLSDLEVAAKIGELDRANLHEGQDVSIQLDAVADRHFHGKIKTLSGTASANIWSGDVAKKFDVIFSVDMRELLTGLGAKPEQIRRVLETAARNRNKPVSPMLASPMMTMAGGPPVGAGDMGAAGPETTGGAAGSGRRRTGGGSEAGGSPEGGAGGGRGGFGMGAGGGQGSSADRQKIRETMQKVLAGRDPQSLSPEERQKLGEQMRAALQQAGMARPSAGGAPQGAGGAPPAIGLSRPGASGSGASGGRPVAAAAGPGERAGSQRPRGGGEGAPTGFGTGGTPQFSQADLDNAELPAPPQEGNQLEVLLRPGLLADVEITVERVPNAIYIPAQAVFERDGKPIVYVKRGEYFDARFIRPLKRSESVMVIAEGLRPGELVALVDPTAKRDQKGKGTGNGGRGGGVPSPAPGAGGNRP